MTLCFQSHNATITRMRKKNPFLTTGYEGRETFCDREHETSELISAIENGRNVTLIAPRRYGKTGLIKNMMAELSDDYEKVYLDIYATESLSDFVELFAKTCLSSLESTREKVISSLGRFFGSLRPCITPQTDGSIKWSFDLAEPLAKESLAMTFDFLRSRSRPVVIAIDEFQQVRSYPEKGVEAMLRSHIQFLPNVRFVFAGSRLHLMSDMFVQPRGAFYNSTDILSLDVIDRKIYCDFAAKFFQTEKLPFSDEAFFDLYDRFDGVTWYIQAVLNRIWQANCGFVSAKDTDGAIDSLVGTRSLVYMDLFRSQSEALCAVLKAVAQEGVAKMPTGRDFLSRYSLGSASTVSSALESLVRKELLYRSYDGYIVYDRLFGIWLKRLCHEYRGMSM